MSRGRFLIFVLLLVGLSTACAKEPDLRLILCVSQWRSEKSNVTFQLVIVNSSAVVKSLSKVGKLDIECKIGRPTDKLAGRFIGISRWLDSDIATVRLKPHGWVAQEFSLRPELGYDMIAEVRVRLEIGTVTHESNTLYLKANAVRSHTNEGTH